MKSIKTVFVLILGMCFFAGCANIPIPGNSDPYKNLSRNEQDDLKLREISKVRVENKQIEDYLEQILAKLYDKETLAKQDIRIALIASPAPGAAVLPSGLVLWHLGMFDYVESEDEIAAILAHEMAHLLQDHHATDQKGALVNDMISAGKAAVVFSDAGSAEELFTAADSLRWASDSVMFPSFTRDQETEADVEGARILVEADYNADAVRVILGTLRNYYGDQEEFVSQEIFGTEKVTENGEERTRIDFSADTVVGNLKGYVENTWGQAYESFTEREAAVRSVLREEFPQRSRSQFIKDRYARIIKSDETKKWLDAYRSGYKLEAMEVTTDAELRDFQAMSERIISNGQTSEVFAYDALFKSALKNGLEQPATDAAAHLIRSNKALLEHYLVFGSLQRQNKNFEKALVAFSLADSTFSPKLDSTILPLIIATKKETGEDPGHLIKIRCMDPRLAAACAQSK